MPSSEQLTSGGPVRQGIRAQLFQLNQDDSGAAFALELPPGRARHLTGLHCSWTPLGTVPLLPPPFHGC